MRRRALGRGDKWRLDEVVVSIAGKKHWLWRAASLRSARTQALATWALATWADATWADATGVVMAA